MRPKKKSFNTFAVFILLFGVGILATNLFSMPSWAYETRSEPAVFSLDVKDEALKVVLGKITKLTGYTIRVNEKWADLPITASMQNVTIEEALKKILDNYALIIENTQKYISIFICGPIRSSNNKQVITLEKPGEGGITKRELNAIMANQKKIDPLNLEVIPPTEPGGKGITQREIDAIRSQQEKIDPLDLEVIPPTEPDGKGIIHSER